VSLCRPPRRAYPIPGVPAVSTAESRRPACASHPLNGLTLIGYLAVAAFTAPASSAKICRFQVSLIRSQIRRYSHQKVVSSGIHRSGPRSPFDLFKLADTAAGAGGQ
jgi:hypothetical protein